MACMLTSVSSACLDSTPQAAVTCFPALTGERPEYAHPSLLSQKEVFPLLESTVLGSCDLQLRTTQCRQGTLSS